VGAGTRRIHSWFRAIVVAVAIIVALTLVFAVVPDRIATVIERHVRGTLPRDVAVTVWFALAVAGSSWALVRLQRRGAI
ncbi:MAG: hypothetical protein HY775_04875, partial [Acidobacteria bacterium]|nr:hypothetical protein [Acidobacteriota bacterium]